MEENIAKRIKLIYIGNVLAVHGVTPTTADVMPTLFREAGYDVLLASSKKNMLLRMLDMLWCIVRGAQSEDYVLIDTYSTKNFWYAYFCSQWCRFLRIRYIPILHGGELPQRMDRSPRMTYSIFEHSFRNVSPSGYLLEALERRGYSATLIPNTISISDYLFTERKVLRPKLLYVRAFAELYNPQMALHVLKALLNDDPDTELCMVGPDKDGTLEQCRKLADELGVGNQVRFTGRLKKKEWKKLSEEYDIFINTTHKDNTPVSVIEAMALGLPVVSTNPGGMSYLIDDGKDGLLVDCADVDAMAGEVRHLLENPDKAVSISRAARSKVEDFDWKRAKGYWEELLCSQTGPNDDVKINF